MPLYRIDTKDAEAIRLVKAKSQAGALNYAARSLVTAELADPEMVHALATQGVKIEDASAEPAPAADPE